MCTPASPLVSVVDYCSRHALIAGSITVHIGKNIGEENAGPTSEGFVVGFREMLITDMLFKLLGCNAAATTS